MGQRGRPRYPDVLTPREQDVLALLREGLTNEQIASRLGISFETAKQHVATILSKLGVTSREEAAAWEAREKKRLSWTRVGPLLAGLSCALLAVVGVLALGWLKVGDGEKVGDTIIHTTETAPATLAPAGDVDNDVAACEEGLALLGEPKTPNDIPIASAGGVVCWKSAESASLYLVRLTVHYWADCDVWQNRIVLDPVISEHTLQADETWAFLPESPDAHYPHANYVSVRIDVVGEDNTLVRQGGSSLTREFDYTRECGVAGIPVPTGAWSECPPISTSEILTGLHVMDAETCELTQVSDVDNAYSMSWSPDGTQLAFTRAQGDALPVNIGTSDLYLAEIDGSGVRQLTNSDGIYEGPPVWSPDGSTLAYSINSVNAAGHTLMVLDIENEQSAAVAQVAECLQGYEWSADSNRILLSVGCGYDEQGVLVINASTGETTTVDGVRSVLAVQPHGDLVAYNCGPIHYPSSYQGICIGSVYERSASEPLTASAFTNLEIGFGETPDSPIFAYSAIWTNDGATLAFIGQSYRNLFLLPADGRPGRFLKDLLHSFIYWASDQVIVTYDCVGTGVVPCGTYELTSVRLDTLQTRASLVLDCGSAGGVWSPDGSKLAISSASFGGCV